MRNVILLVLVQVHISYSKWACNEDNGWLIDLKDINNFDGGSTCRKDSFNANCKAYGLSDQVECNSGGEQYHYTWDADHCDAMVACINAFPTFYADEYPRVPSCDQVDHEGKTYNILKGGDGACADLAKGLDSADLCGMKTCNDQGRCFNGDCYCADGYTGKDCEYNIDDCDGVTCSNKGKCVDGVGAYTCSCIAGYSGDDCETDIDDCAGVTCPDGDYCIDGVNSYTCTCDTRGGNDSSEGTTCGPGLYVHGSECKGCASGKYKEGTDSASQCSTCDNSVCADGKYRSGQCTASSNGYTCKMCGADTYKVGNNDEESCAACSNVDCESKNGLATPYKYRSGTCSGATDGYECNDCSNTQCGPGEYRAGACDTSDSYTCEACVSGQYKDEDEPNADTSCSVCDNIECGEGLYRTGSCAASSNGFECKKCDTGYCKHGTNGAEECVKCTTATSTATSTPTTTMTTAPACFGRKDTDLCAVLLKRGCDGTFFGSKISLLCPAGCDACIATATTTETTSVTSTQTTSASTSGTSTATSSLLTTALSTDTTTATTSVTTTGSTTDTTTASSTGTSTKSSTATTSVTSTVTTTLGCEEGGGDDADCKLVGEDACGLVFKFRGREMNFTLLCPGLCDSCSTKTTTFTTTASSTPTTTRPSTITTTQTSTATTAPRCFGQLDDHGCRKMAGKCGTKIRSGSKIILVDEACPAMCDACKSSTQTTTATSTLTTTDTSSLTSTITSTVSTTQTTSATSTATTVIDVAIMCDSIAGNYYFLIDKESPLSCSKQAAALAGVLALEPCSAEVDVSCVENYLKVDPSDCSAAEEHIAAMTGHAKTTKCDKDFEGLLYAETEDKCKSVAGKLMKHMLTFLLDPDNVDTSGCDSTTLTSTGTTSDTTTATSSLTTTVTTTVTTTGRCLLEEDEFGCTDLADKCGKAPFELLGKTIDATKSCPATCGTCPTFECTPTGELFDGQGLEEALLTIPGDATLECKDHVSAIVAATDSDECLGSLKGHIICQAFKKGDGSSHNVLRVKTSTKVSMATRLLSVLSGGDAVESWQTLMRTGADACPTVAAALNTIVKQKRTKKVIEATSSCLTTATTTASSTATTTGTSTPITQGLCNGKEDKDSCTKLTGSYACTDVLFGVKIADMCPVACDACVATQTSTATSSITTTITSTATSTGTTSMTSSATSTEESTVTTSATTSQTSTQSSTQTSSITSTQTTIPTVTTTATTTITSIGMCNGRYDPDACYLSESIDCTLVFETAAGKKVSLSDNCPVRCGSCISTSPTSTATTSETTSATTSATTTATTSITSTVTTSATSTITTGIEAVFSCKTYLNVTYISAPTDKGQDCFKYADVLSKILTDACPSVVTYAPLTCNAGNHLLHIEPANKTCSAAARAIKNLASGVVGNEVGDIQCINDRYFSIKNGAQCEGTVLALNTVYQHQMSGRGDLPFDFKECNDPTTQTTTATSTATTAEYDTQCAFASWSSSNLLVTCTDYNLRWFNQLLRTCGSFDADGKDGPSDTFACENKRLVSATADLCAAQVALLNKIVRDVSYNADPLHFPFNCGDDGNVVTYYTHDTASCNADVGLLDKAKKLLMNGQFDGCMHNTETSTATSTVTSTKKSTETSTATATATTTATTTVTTGRRCNGEFEPEECAALSESDCGRGGGAAGVFDVSSNCRALCGTCTTSTTTTTTGVCNGMPDPDFCQTELSGGCGTISSANLNVDEYCPVMCNSCIPTTSTTTETATTTTNTITTTTLDPLIVAQNGDVKMECAAFSGKQLVTVVADRAACHYRVAKALGIVAQGCLRGFPNPEYLLECHAASSNNGFLLYGGDPATCMETAGAIGAGLRNNGLTAGFGCSSDGYLTMNTPCGGSMLSVVFAAAGNQQRKAQADPQPPGQPPFVDANRDCTPVAGDTGVRATFYFGQDNALTQLAGAESGTWEQAAFKDTLAASLQSQLNQDADAFRVVTFNPANGQVEVEIPAPGMAGGLPSATVTDQLNTLLTSEEAPFTFSYGGVALISSSAADDSSAHDGGPSTGLIVVLVLITLLLVGVVIMLANLRRARNKVSQDHLLNPNYSVKQMDVFNPPVAFDNN